jgi:hypothetical protein
VNSAQIVNGTLNVNETVRLAESALETLTQPLGRPSNTRQTKPRPANPRIHVQADRELVARSG